MTQTPEHIATEAMSAVMKVANTHAAEVEADDLAYDVALSLLGLVFVMNADQISDVKQMLDSDIKGLLECQQAGGLGVQ